MKKIAVVILNWNGYSETVGCLQSIVKSHSGNFELSVTVIDNGSTDDSFSRLANYYQLFQQNEISYSLIKNPANLGFSAANNQGIDSALKKGADYIVLLNNDTLVDTFLFRNLFLAAEKNNQSGIIGPKIYFAKNYEFHKNRYQENERGKVIWYAGGLIDWNNVYCHHRGVDEVDHGQYDKTEETDFVSGCCMLVKKEVFAKTGLFDPAYYLYLEDVDLCLRAKRHGYELSYAPEAYLWHKNAQSSGQPGSKMHDYYLTRNRLLFGFKYAPWRTKLALLKESFRLAKENKVKRRAVFDFWTQRFGKGSF